MEAKLTLIQMELQTQAVAAALVEAIVQLVMEELEVLE